jgi:hypothetical protein
VLAGRDGCSVEKCDALIRFRDQSHVLANLRDRTFEEQVTKHTASWNAPRADGPALAAAGPSGPSAAMPQNLSPGPAPVSPRYDFPSSQSIPAVNIMAPEPAAPRGGGAGQAAAPVEGNSGATTPVPPRRPPQVRGATAAPPRGAAQAAPAAPAGETPTDGSVPRPSAPLSQRP